LFDRHDPIEVADIVLDDGQQVEQGVACRDLRVIHGELGPHLTAPLTHPPRHEEQVTRLLRADVVGDGRFRRWKHEPELAQPIFHRAHCAPILRHPLSTYARRSPPRS
jgi:hypothetical protein